MQPKWLFEIERCSEFWIGWTGVDFGMASVQLGPIALSWEAVGGEGNLSLGAALRAIADWAGLPVALPQLRPAAVVLGATAATAVALDVALGMVGVPW